MAAEAPPAALCRNFTKAAEVPILTNLKKRAVVSLPLFCDTADMPHPFPVHVFAGAVNFVNYLPFSKIRSQPFLEKS